MESESTKSVTDDRLKRKRRSIHLTWQSRGLKLERAPQSLSTSPFYCRVHCLFRDLISLSIFINGKGIKWTLL
ncbi:hypothetical protein L6452_00780 [Arctium lappa]|uniref:Uncharacterized protein n=1 Tax=Arctium lappa TaxID=4217 RepID=A0ACB9FF98_ARCLA|nr:hypothetical protein L6452_00780 [Arctium lappa]